jgi:hypothetical protein
MPTRTDCTAMTFAHTDFIHPNNPNTMEHDETYENDDLDMTSSIGALLLFILIILIAAIAYICWMSIRTITYVLLYPLCLLFFAWIEYPLWAAIRYRRNHAIRVRLIFSDHEHKKVGYVEDPNGDFLVLKPGVVDIAHPTKEPNPGNFFSWFWKRMYDKSHVA